MVTSKKALEKIRKIINKTYRRIAAKILGIDTLSEEDQEKLGLKLTNQNSLMEMAYYHNFINNPRREDTPPTLEGIKAQQQERGILPQGAAHDYSVENMNDKTLQSIFRLKEDVISRLEGYIRDNNDKYKLDALKNVNRDEVADHMVKESSLGEVKKFLRDSVDKASKDWQRVALTEMSNAIGIGSVDRIVSDNLNENLEEVYVYRIVVGDATTCRYCRRFYGDVGEIPKIYKLSTILSNGSNFGKKKDNWKAVIGATHPNTRTSPILQVRPGFAVSPGGALTFIGMEKWKNWIHEHLEA